MPETIKEALVKSRTKVINSMSDAADAFYRSALDTRVQTWLEVTGLMRTLIQVYRGMLGKCVDPLANSPAPEGHHVAYIAEKLDCIFGDAVRGDHRLAQTFIAVLQEKGWPVRYAKRVAQ